jgi:hypothetical protein
LIDRSTVDARRQGPHELGRYPSGTNLLQRGLVLAVVEGRRGKFEALSDGEAFRVRAIESTVEALTWIIGVGAVLAPLGRGLVARACGAWVGGSVGEKRLRDRHPEGVPRIGRVSGSREGKVKERRLAWE